MWSLTHDKHNFHHHLYAYLVSEQLTSNAPVFIENDKDTSEHDNNPNLCNKLDDLLSHKRYSIRLSRRKCPFNVDVAHQLVIKSVARFSTAEVSRLFGMNVDDESVTNTLGVQFVNYFVRWPIRKRQEPLIQMLKNRNLKYLLMNESDLIATHLIQCISKSLPFISDENVRNLLSNSIFYEFY